MQIKYKFVRDTKSGRTDFGGYYTYLRITSSKRDPTVVQNGVRVSGHVEEDINRIRIRDFADSCIEMSIPTTAKTINDGSDKNIIKYQTLLKLYNKGESV